MLYMQVLVHVFTLCHDEQYSMHYVKYFRYWLQGCFDRIITNPAKYVDGALRIGPYHEVAHGCQACPPNLCKGLVTPIALRCQAMCRSEH